MERYQELRKEYPLFYYRGYDCSENDRELAVTFRFEIGGLSIFEPSWRFIKPEGVGMLGGRDALLKRELFLLGMVELVSYWKITCAPQVVIEGDALSEEELDFWKELYYHGLGEFFYVNGIREATPENFMDLKAKECTGKAPEGGPDRTSRPGILVPVGGGKDSAVSLELLKKAGIDCYAYIINPRGASIRTCGAAGLDEGHIICVSRTLDGRMLKLNLTGRFLNGHTPFSALVAFSSLITARLWGLDRIALSNESSANESTVSGSSVNHQYSKSFKFEKDFHAYCEKWLNGSAYYFSLLRPLSEFQIAKFFARQKRYHAVFRSCNVGSKRDVWCGACPKCLFVYLILSPFLETEELERIFSRNMLEDEAMLPLLKQLTGMVSEKPFECVGSRDEINTAAVMTIQKMQARGQALPKLLSFYKNCAGYRAYRDKGDAFSGYFDEENLVPEPLKALVRENCVDE